MTQDELETGYEREGQMPWCSKCERYEEDCTCNPDGDETVEQYEALKAARLCGTCGNERRLYPEGWECATCTAAPAAKLQPGERNSFYGPDLEAFRPKVGICDVCGGDQDRILPDGICMPCSIAWEFNRK